jgi:CO/xanthine dehydrogenase FAD-binding subunit
MGAPLNQVIFPESFQELFASWNRFPDAILYAGGTDLISRQERSILELPVVFICLGKIPELHRVTRTEQYLEIGSMTKLSKLLELGKIVPKVLQDCVKNIAGVQLRNIATIGGNICSEKQLFDIPAPLIALDAQYELRGDQSTRWVSAARFHSSDDTSLEKLEFLTRVRLPLHQWNYEVYRKFYCEGYSSSESLVFLAKVQKNILSELRVVFKENTILRNKNGEDMLNGKFLPLHRKTAIEFVDNWKEFLKNKQGISEFSKFTFLNSIEENIFILSE